MNTEIVQLLEEHDRARRALLEEEAWPGLERHLSVCPVCRKLAARLARLEDMTPGIPPPRRGLLAELMLVTSGIPTPRPGLLDDLRQMTSGSASSPAEAGGNRISSARAHKQLRQQDAEVLGQRPHHQLAPNLPSVPQLAQAGDVDPHALSQHPLAQPRRRPQPPASARTDAVRADRQQLLHAVAEGRGMDAVYYAKRLLQVSGVDQEVIEALAGLSPMDFRYVNADGEERVNPVLAHLAPAGLRQMLGQGQLLERSYNDVLCRRGDNDSTMFVILRGQVGVYTADDEPVPKRARPRVTLSEGQIIGELAFALSRRRTADLVSLGNTALLSFEYDDVATLLSGRGEMIWDFMNRRALEHVSENVPYLIGRELSALPQDERQMWRGMLNVLRTDCQIISRTQNQRITQADVRPGEDGQAGGIYILASGLLQSESIPEKQLDGDGFPLLYVDLPELVVAPDHAYTVEEGPAKIIFIGLEAINTLRPPLRAKLVGQLKRSMSTMYHYDAFIAYTAADEGAAERWERSLREAGLHVFRDSLHPGDAYPERVGAALLDSLTTLVLLSRRTADREADRNWVRKEIDFRKQHFDRQPQIVPIQLPGGDPKDFELSYAPIDAVRREQTAIEEAVSLIRAIRSGDSDPPYALRRQVECQDCGGRIPRERLWEKPEATRCASCEARQHRTARPAASASSPSSGARPRGTTTADAERIARLEANRAALARLASQFAEEAGLSESVAESMGGVLTRDNEDTDFAQVMSDREVNERLMRLLSENADKVERALRRIAAGKYGECEDCGVRIPTERLRFRPEATRCVDCQARHEGLNQNQQTA